MIHQLSCELGLGCSGRRVRWWVVQAAACVDSMFKTLSRISIDESYEALLALPIVEYRILGNVRAIVSVTKHFPLSTKTKDKAR